MPLNHDAVGARGEPGESSWNSKDAILYALGVGCGVDDLPFTTENTQGVEQQVLPTMGVVLPVGGRGAWDELGDVNWTMLVHGEQAIELHQPIPVEGTCRSVTTVTASTTRAPARWSQPRPSRSTRTRASRCSRRGRPRSSAAKAVGEATGARAAANVHMRPSASPDHVVKYQTSTRPGTHLPTVRRPQPVALRPVVRARRRVRHADPPRPVHLRLHRSCAVAYVVRIGSVEVQVDGGSVQLTGVPRRRAHDLDVADRRRRSGLPDPAPGDVVVLDNGLCRFSA